MTTESKDTTFEFNYPGINGIISSQLKFYNAGDGFYFAVSVDGSGVFVRGSADRATTFSEPKKVLDLKNVLRDVQFLPEKEKFVLAITEDGPTSTKVRAAFGHLDKETNTIISQECPRSHEITTGVVLNVQLLFIDYARGETKEHVFIKLDDDRIQEQTGRHP